MGKGKVKEGVWGGHWVRWGEHKMEDGSAGSKGVDTGRGGGGGGGQERDMCEYPAVVSWKHASKGWWDGGCGRELRVTGWGWVGGRKMDDGSVRSKGVDMGGGGGGGEERNICECPAVSGAKA